VETDLSRLHFAPPAGGATQPGANLAGSIHKLARV
jgi:hypothetical protein